MIFKIVVDVVIRAVLDVICGTQETQHGLGWAAGKRNLVFYADYGRIAGRYHKWVQDALTVTVVMFYRMVLETNLENTKSMVYTPGFIWGEWGERAYKEREIGEGATFRERNSTWVSCNECNVTMATSYLKITCSGSMKSTFPIKGEPTREGED